MRKNPKDLKDCDLDIMYQISYNKACLVSLEIEGCMCLSEKQSDLTVSACVFSGEGVVPEQAHEVETLQRGAGSEGQGEGAAGQERV